MEVIQPACADQAEEDEEESHFSEGQVIASSSLSISEESEISEEIPKQEMGQFSCFLFLQNKHN